MSRKKSTFGTVVAQKSGRYSARYNDPDGNRRSVTGTLATEADAWAALAVVRADMLRGQWINPDDGDISFADFAEVVREYRSVTLSARTQQENVYLLRALLPTSGTSRSTRFRPRT